MKQNYKGFRLWSPSINNQLRVNTLIIKFAWQQEEKYTKSS